MNMKGSMLEQCTSKGEFLKAKVPEDIELWVKMKEIYEEITVHAEDSHDYLGMIMTHDVKNKKVKIDMKRYICECIDEFEENEPDEK